MNQKAYEAGIGRLNAALDEGARLLYVTQDKAEDLVAMVLYPGDVRRPQRAVLLLQRFYLQGMSREQIGELSREVVANSHQYQRHEARDRNAHQGGE